ncbi:MAG: hypothetical protein LC776_10680 [Acidobacteria bacterium]|nr:hypothetical protein [Acidobacteriota bacterium]
MRRAGRIIVGSILGLSGIIIAGVGVYLLLQGPDLLQGLELGGMVLLGLALTVSGLAVALGMHIRDIIERLLLGTSTL